jgi:hypothetical protein
LRESSGFENSLAEVVTELDNMRALYPNLISVRQSIGLSLESRDLWMVKISDNPDVDETEQEILYTGLHHAREPRQAGHDHGDLFHVVHAGKLRQRSDGHESGR